MRCVSAAEEKSGRGDIRQPESLDCGVEKVEKKQCCKCIGHKALEVFGGDNATCTQKS